MSTQNTFVSTPIDQRFGAILHQELRLPVTKVILQLAGPIQPAAQNEDRGFFYGVILTEEASDRGFAPIPTGRGTYHVMRVYLPPVPAKPVEGVVETDFALATRDFLEKLRDANRDDPIRRQMALFREGLVVQLDCIPGRSPGKYGTTCYQVFGVREIGWMPMWRPEQPSEERSESEGMMGAPDLGNAVESRPVAPSAPVRLL